MLIPCFPDFVPLTMELKSEMHPKLSLTPDGVSEYTFADLYLFRKRYNYRVSRVEDKTFILSGIQPPPGEELSDPSAPSQGRRFFCTPCASPGRGILGELFKTHDYWKGIPDAVLTPNREHLEAFGITFTEDRDNFDYLYLRTELAALSGKRFHKKKNLVNAFNNAYPGHEMKILRQGLIPDALEVLEKWREDKGSGGDYTASRESLEFFEELNMKGALFYIEGKPAGYCLGETLARGRMFTIHFEKALDAYKGIYQYINQAYAASLPNYLTYINREQDLGDEGLRQSKMTYRPCGFVRKFTGHRPETPGS
ncbi:MAG: DUF2156 domain-containing protein [Treponema sp.]|jgi:hypothetical protein|nr:DUF2156 domain-containing protein [Treponema sp.]